MDSCAQFGVDCVRVCGGVGGGGGGAVTARAKACAGGSGKIPPAAAEAASPAVQGARGSAGCQVGHATITNYFPYLG